MKDLLEKIKHHEGFVEHVYDDSLGIPTIGYGFAIKDLVLDEDIAEEILIRKLEKLKRNANARFKWLEDMPQEVQEVVLNMCYQLGVTGVSKFRKAISAMQEGEWSEAADEMLDSLWARQTPNRAKELSDIVRNQVEKISS
jgi:lysozyme|tara:strand:- start:319 stop:741 length:423 start_codon:yes stop_codon:yes gene_type:complete